MARRSVYRKFCGYEHLPTTIPRLFDSILPRPGIVRGLSSTCQLCSLSRYHECCKLLRGCRWELCSCAGPAEAAGAIPRSADRFRLGLRTRAESWPPYDKTRGSRLRLSSRLHQVTVVCSAFIPNQKQRAVLRHSFPSLRSNRAAQPTPLLLLRQRCILFPQRSRQNG
jgi:hypothetical protein